MSGDEAHDMDRRAELLVDRALAGLTPEEAEELGALVEDEGELEEYDLAAAALDLAVMGMGDEPLPAALRARVEADAGIEPASTAPASKAPPPSSRAPAPVISLDEARREARRDIMQFAGWGAAAACLLIAGWALFAQPEVPPVVIQQPAPTAPIVRSVEPAKPKTAAEEREALLTRAKDVVKIAWSATRDPAGQGASGDVVWSQAEQRGYMRFHGLAALDPKKAQFQLWIFDKARDDRFPVDGGVFDVGAVVDPASGDVIVPITAKLRVEKPALFAVTVEPPGGVVVSKREHVVLTAASTG